MQNAAHANLIDVEVTKNKKFINKRTAPANTPSPADNRLCM